APGAATLVFGINAFSTIQAGIEGVGSGGTVYVLPGTYAENVIVDKSVSLLGPNQGTSGNGSRSAEAIVEPSAASDFNISSIFVVQASNVTINGFTIQGSNSSLSSGGFVLTSGTRVYAAAGVSNSTNINTGGPGGPTTNISNLVVRDNIIQDFTQLGVY